MTTHSQGSAMRLEAARQAIIDILDDIESEDLPPFTDKDGCVWFEDMNMGWISATNPATLADGEVYRLFCAEAAGRELARRERAS